MREIQHQQHKSTADYLQTNVKNLVNQSLSFFCNFVSKLGAFIVYYLSFKLADLNKPKEQSSSIRYLWLEPVLIRSCLFQELNVSDFAIFRFRVFDFGRVTQHLDAILTSKEKDSTRSSGTKMDMNSTGLTLLLFSCEPSQ